MKMKSAFPLVLLLLAQTAAAQPPPRRHPLPPSERLRPAVDRPARTNDRPRHSGGLPLLRTDMPETFRALPGPQIGLNFVRFFWDDNRRGPAPALDCYKPDVIFKDLDLLGAASYRQFVKADLLWDLVEPADGQWTFSNADAVVPHPDFIPIPTLFAMQYASPTPPWERDPAKFQKTLGPEAVH